MTFCVDKQNVRLNSKESVRLIITLEQLKITGDCAKALNIQLIESLKRLNNYSVLQDSSEHGFGLLLEICKTYISDTFYTESNC